MRRLAAALLLACARAAADDGLFAAPPEQEFDEADAPGARARFAEALGLLGARVAADPADAAAYDATTPLARRFAREGALADRLRRLCARADLPEARLAALRRALGHLLVEWARGDAPEALGGVVFRAWWGDEVDADALRREALPHLLAAVAADARDRRSLLDCAEALEALDAKGSAAEAAELRRRAGPDPPAPPAAPPLEGTDLAAATGALLAQALALETRDPPDLEASLALRRRALLQDVATQTIPFEVEERLYPLVSLLAGADEVHRCLTRQYRTAAGRVGTVPPHHYPPSDARRREVVAELARDGSPAACAALLGLVRRARSADGPVAGVVEALARARPAPLLARLPDLLRHALGERGYGPHARRHLVRLAALLRLEAAAPALRAALPEDRDLACPADVALALGHVGSPEDADLLLGVAGDAARDVYFRRRAVDALGRLAPNRLLDLPEDPLLDVARVAARCRADRGDEAARARLLRALQREHEADDAAAYCAELGLVEALPGIEEALARREDYAVEPLRAAAAALRALER